MINYSLRQPPADKLTEVSLREFRDIVEKDLIELPDHETKAIFAVLTCYSETICRVPPTLCCVNIAATELNDMPLSGYVVPGCNAQGKYVTHEHAAVRNFLFSRIPRQQRSVIEPRRCRSHESFLIICL